MVAQGTAAHRVAEGYEPPVRRWLPILLISCSSPDPFVGTDIADAFRALHRPIYGVYELTAGQRDALHDLLARSFRGAALTDQYVEHFTTLHRMATEETSIRVIDVDYATVRVLDDTGPVRRVDVDWSVGGVVTHRDHKHPRVNRYRAIYSLAMTQDGPRIVATRMRNLERVRSPLQGWSFDAQETGGEGLLDPLDLLNAGVGDE